MQEYCGWETADPLHAQANTWQAQWESRRDGGESSAWGAHDWSQLENFKNSYHEEFENIMHWDDSGALDAFEISRKANEEHLKGIVLSVSLPSPDLYIQVIDWDSHEDLKLPDSLGTFSPPRKGERKRGRRASGGFRRQFDRDETLHAVDSQQSNSPFLQVAYRSEGNAKTEKEHDVSPGAGMLQGTSHLLPKVGPTSMLQSNKQVPTKSNCTSYNQKQSSNRIGHGRSPWDEPQNLQFHSNQQRWRPTNKQSDQERWGQGGSYQSFHKLSNTSYSQVAPTAQGNYWMPQQENAAQRLAQQSPLFHFTACSRQQHAPGYVPDETCRWKAPQNPDHKWH